MRRSNGGRWLLLRRHRRTLLDDSLHFGSRKTVDSLEIEQVASNTLLSELYAVDVPEAVLLAEYPSSNSDQTRFRNTDKYLIHDPFPPPKRELLKCLGPHHLMYAWGDRLDVTSQLEPPEILLDHWCDLLGAPARPNWVDFDQLQERQFITLFPHQVLSAEQQLVDPDVNYFLHSKQVIEQIDCSQAKVFSTAQYPCIAKISHGYAGLGNFVLKNAVDKQRMNDWLEERWPTAEVVFNSIIEDVVGDYGVQFYLAKNGAVRWLGLTQQNFEESGKWCGGTYSAGNQLSLMNRFHSIIVAAAEYLAGQGYFGVVGIDILENRQGGNFLVDVNPRLTGITPFLMASRRFADDLDLGEGQYRASCRFSGTLEQLLATARSYQCQRVAVLSAFEDAEAQQTICHLSVSSGSQDDCSSVFDQLLS